MTEIIPLLDAVGSFATLRQAFGVDDDAAWELPFHAFLLRGNGWTALVDTGVGPPGEERFLPDRQGWLPGLLDPEEIEVVLLTHMHVDHVGWNMLAGAPFFPNARYLGHRADFELFTQEHAHRPYVRDQLLGLAATGRLELVDDGTAPLPGVALEHVPGHTPGHCIVRVDDAVLLGDLAVHELQLADPGLAYVAEEDAPAAAAARRRFLPALAASGAVVGLGHLRPPLGHIAAAGEGFAWRPLD
jgi:glyoxylase-like metal-dependent hydrolase (beta-lactamase superfamily II)